MLKQERLSLKETAKEQIKGHIGQLVAIAVIVISITAAITGMAAPSDYDVCGVGYKVFKGCLSGAANFLLFPAFTLGTIMVYLDLTQKKEVKIVRLFDGFTPYGKVVLLQILVAVFTFLWGLLLIVPGIIKALSYSQSFYILATHPEMTASEALDASKKLMDGHKAEYFYLLLTFLGWGLLFLITCGIAGIYTIPYFQATMADYYQKISSDTNSMLSAPATAN